MSNVLLDFDGVLFKNKKIHDLIKERSVCYVSHRMKVSKLKANDINTYHYKNFGHTTIHMKSNENNINVNDYNNLVFENLNWDYIESLITQDDIDHMQLFLDTTDNRCMHYLFSNAPLSYCDNIMRLHGYNLFEVFDHNVFTSDIINIRFKEDNNLLKPLPGVYDKIDEFFSSHEKPIHFIDDSQINLDPLKYNHRWNTYLLNMADNSKYKHEYEKKKN